MLIKVKSLKFLLEKEEVTVSSGYVCFKPNYLFTGKSYYKWIVLQVGYQQS